MGCAQADLWNSNAARTLTSKLLQLLNAGKPACCSESTQPAAARVAWRTQGIAHTRLAGGPHWRALHALKDDGPARQRPNGRLHASAGGRAGRRHDVYRPPRWRGVRWLRRLNVTALVEAAVSFGARLGGCFPRQGGRREGGGVSRVGAERARARSKEKKTRRVSLC